eukprot:10366650-Alexandrium_andersonii.AAC.1
MSLDVPRCSSMSLDVARQFLFAVVVAGQSSVQLACAEKAPLDVKMAPCAWDSHSCVDCGFGLNANHSTVQIGWARGATKQSRRIFATCVGYPLLSGR